MPITKSSANPSWKKLGGFPIDRRLRNAVRKKHIDYQDRLRILELPTLMYRRDMIGMFKHFHVYDKRAIFESFRPKERVSRTHDFQLYNRTAKDGIRDIQNNLFCYRSVNTWNNLPRNAVNAKHINTFKTLLDKRWENELWKFNHEARLIDTLRLS